jgi:hypothetical protein
MRRIYASSIIAVSLACVPAGRASADFIELPASAIATEVSAAQDAAQASPSPLELRQESSYLELGYYAVHGARVQKQLARPADAGLGGSSGYFARFWATELRGAPALASTLALLLVTIAAFVTRRTRRV